jgi:hypothetical protein
VIADDRPGSRYSTFLERLRARSLSSWDHGERAPRALDAARELARLAWAAEHQPGVVPDVPELGHHALADQLTVLLLDAEHSGADKDVLDGIVDRLAATLSVRMS